MEIPDHLTYLLRNLYAGQEATVRTRHGTMTGSKLGKECIKPVYWHPAYLTSMQSTSCEMMGWMKHKLESRLPNLLAYWVLHFHSINNLRYANDITLMAENKELKNILMTVKEESEKAGLKLNIQKIQSHHFMANRWGNNGNSDRLLSWAPKSLQMVTAAMKFKDACSLEKS